jgi:hypothetical protein
MEEPRCTARKDCRVGADSITVVAALALGVQPSAAAQAAAGGDPARRQRAVADEALDRVISRAGRAVDDVQRVDISAFPWDVNNAPICFAASAGPITSYELMAAYDYFEGIRKDLIAGLKADTDLLPLLSYVAQAYPTPKFEVQAGECTGHRPVVTQSSMRDNRDRVVSLIQRLQRILGERGIAMTVKVKTEPTDADFTMAAMLGQSPPRATRSDAVLPNVYLGLYRFTVRKAGHEPIDGTLNLVEEVGPLLDCKLRPTGEKATGCRFAAE